MAIRIIIADDHAVVRAGLKSMMLETDILIVGEAANGEQAIELAHEHQPDLVLLDVRMPKTDGLIALARLRTEIPNMPILMFSTYNNPTYVARAVALGAVGYLIKTATREELIAAIRTVATGETIWSREELRRVSGSISSPRIAADLEVPLTKREGEVLKQLSLGLSNKEIAQTLSISYETVKEHVQHILRKLGVSDRTQAAVWAVRREIA